MLRAKRSLLATDFNPSKIPGLVLWLEPSLGGVYSGNAAQFTAANSEYLSVASAAGLQIGNNAFDIVSWVYLDSLPGTDAKFAIVAKWVAATKEYYLSVFNNSGAWTRFDILVRKADDSGDFEVSASTFGNVTTSTWYMVHVYHDPTADVIGISVNNGAHDTVAAVGGGRSTATAFQLGATADPGSYHNGRMTSTAIWQHATTNLTAAQITYLYNNGVPHLYNELDSNLKANLVSWYPLQGISGNRADSHGSNTLTDNNTVTVAAGPALLPAGNNDPIRQVNDLSGLGNHATQTPGTAQPLKIDNGVAGLPVIRFDGSSDYMTTATLKPAAVAQPTTIIAVTKVAAVAAASVIFDGVGTRQYLFKNGGSATGGAFYGAATQVTGEDPHTWGSFEVYTCVFNNTSSVLYINGVTKGTGTAGTVALTRVILGDNGTPGSAPANMDLACLLAYGGVLSMTQLRQLNHYFGSRYGIKVS